MAKETLIYGLRPVKEAVLAGQELERVFFKKGLQGEAYTEVLKVVRDNNIPFQFVPVEKLNRFTGKNHQGITTCFGEPYPIPGHRRGGAAGF